MVVHKEYWYTHILEAQEEDGGLKKSDKRISPKTKHVRPIFPSLPPRLVDSHNNIKNLHFVLPLSTIFSTRGALLPFHVERMCLTNHC